MPKEFVESKYLGQTYPIRDGVTGDQYDEAPVESTRLRIGWSKEAGHVEVATVAPDGVVLEPGVEANGWFMQLDRGGINHAIKVLRQARDQAYGKDE